MKTCRFHTNHFNWIRPFIPAVVPPCEPVPDEECQPCDPSYSVYPERPRSLEPRPTNEV